MVLEKFTDRIEVARRRADELAQRAESRQPPRVEDLEDAVEELSTALEELQVAEEELRQQNDELASSRDAAEQERRRYEELFQSAPDGYVVSDAAGAIRQANTAAGALFGLQPQSLRGKPLAAYVDVRDRRRFRSLLLRQGQRETNSIELRLAPRAGEPVHASLRVVAIPSPDDGTPELRWTLRDITRLRAAEQELRHLNAELERRVAERTEELERSNAAREELLQREMRALAETEASQRRLAFLDEASAAVASSLDVDVVAHVLARSVVPELADWCAVDLVQPDGALERAAAAAEDPLLTMRVYELHQVCPDGGGCGLLAPRPGPKGEIVPVIAEPALEAAASSPRHLQLLREVGFRSVMRVPLIGREAMLGVVTFAFGHSGRAHTGQDLSAAGVLARRAALAVDNARLYRLAQEEVVRRRSAESARAQAETHFRMALEPAPICMFEQDRELRYTWAYNPPGWFSTDALGKTDEELLPADQAGRLAALKRRVLETGAGAREEVPIDVGGETRWFDTTLEPHRNAEGEIVGITGVAMDVTERRRSAEELARERGEVEQLNQRLQRTMMETHHRVKNNLQIIAAMVDMQLMADGEAVPAAEMRRIGASVRALAAVHEILTGTARAEGEARHVSARALLDRLLSQLRETTGKQRIRYALDDALLTTRQGSSLALITNELVANALKHGKGEVVVRFATEGDCARLEVADDGPGFDAEFDPAGSARTGLDLVEYLCQWDLAGAISYETAPEGGARVVLTMPITAAEG